MELSIAVALPRRSCGRARPQLLMQSSRNVPGKAVPKLYEPLCECYDVTVQWKLLLALKPETLDPARTIISD